MTKKRKNRQKKKQTFTYKLEQLKRSFYFLEIQMLKYFWAELQLPMDRLFSYFNCTRIYKHTYRVLPTNKPLKCTQNRRFTQYGLPFNQFSMFWVNLTHGHQERILLFNAWYDAWIYNSLDVPVELSCASIYLYIRSQYQYSGKKDPCLTFGKSWIWRSVSDVFYIQ